MRYLYLIPILLTIILWSSCRKDFEFDPSSGNLEFSQDTVFLDTIFTNISSRTYSFTVRNTSKDAIEIPTIRLGNGQDSRYRLNVDGEAGKEFQNIPILAQDSIFIFIETTVPASAISEVEFLYTDAILFDSGSNQQQVQLVTLVKDAVFLFSNTLSDNTAASMVTGLDANGNEISVEGFTLNDDQLNFTNEKPYVIYGYAAVADEKQLTIDAGARVHFHENSGIIVQEGASLQINGSLSTDQELLENEVIFEGDRLEPEFSNTPGQWGSIWLSAGSINNTINYLTLKNATVGILVEGDGLLSAPTLTIKNTQIFNSLNTNILATSAYINAENLVLGSAGSNSLHCNLGGTYTFIHSTIANYWVNGFRTNAALRLDNSDNDLNANFNNCIIDGNNSIELDLNNTDTNTFDFSFTNCMIKFEDTRGFFIDNPLYDFTNLDFYNEVLINQETDFKDTRNNNFNIGELSEAGNNANIASALIVPLDILGFDRTNTPAIGAYQICITEDTVE